MSKPATTPLNRRASHAEAVTPTAAQQWACCAAGLGGAWQPVVASQFAIYQVAHHHAVVAVRRAQDIADAAQWN